MKLLLLLCCCLPALNMPAQPVDSVKKEKWINFKRTSGMRDPQLGSREIKEKIYLTDNGDTLKRTVLRNSVGGDILLETSYLNNKKNGLEIRYHANGIIASIDYYLNDRIWETVSAADSSGKLLYPGSLHDGNGTKIEYDWGLYSTWLTTYRNGLPEGPYYIVHDEDTTFGNLTYKQSAVNYVPAKKCVYIDDKADTVTEKFYEDEFIALFKDSSLTGYWKLLTSINDSLPQRSQEFIHLNGLIFEDPAILPTGIWTLNNVPDKGLKKVVHDDNGNAVRDTYYEKSGKIISNRKFPPCNKRKIVVRNPDGSFKEETCPL